MTSNIGADLIKGGGGFGFQPANADRSHENVKSILMKEIERFFRPEFINRLDDVIVFRPLTRDDLVQIVEYEVAKVAKRIAEQGLKTELTQAAKDFLIEKGYNPDFGARPLRRAIGNYIEDPLSEQLLSGALHGKNHILVDYAEGEDGLMFKASHKAEPEDTADQEVSTQST
jgi:ATP-dependent Clp protease ATP-binding subunit ClpC